MYPTNIEFLLPFKGCQLCKNFKSKVQDHVDNGKATLRVFTCEYEEFCRNAILVSEWSETKGD